MNREERYMSLAIQMARETVGQTAPNPSVAAVVVKENQVVGIGVHVKAGEPHAEVHALRMAGEKAEGAEIYVTLEPCSHYGRTPPCAKSIVEAGISQVYIASHDPNPKVAGQGVELMKSHGVKVTEGILRQEADALNESFFHFIQSKRPYVRLKSAMSLDGKIATSTGESQWITGEGARLDGHAYRHQSDAILVGINTILADDPTLTTRIEGGGRQPVRMVLDSHLRTPTSSKLIQNQEAPTWIFVNNEVEQERIRDFDPYTHVRIVQQADPQINVEQVLAYAGEQKITSLLVEGGGTVADAFVRTGNVDETVTYIAPKLIGGKDALTPVSGKGIDHLQDAELFEVSSTEMVGGDVKIVSKKKRGY
ncbi:bifunctional diaminohydroxyphosphoribosylaminopyrimidine deaminase/5-amino-6-(5-phosphoribosylamino)uracil reductase RibD [Halobacillus locisalis]|uniref:bifunctional diaminohydroxyphosphoribosylaminopyrimidine deaminase/5-amino-6-(5-phosphoribosylamino)uracil reductase RibD n=1 Tax=Halobacillus locisalis TaxID=220753 RepID=UPI0031B6269C